MISYNAIRKNKTLLQVLGSRKEDAPVEKKEAEKESAS